MIEVSCALIIQNGKVLIAQNGLGSDHAFRWEFPGGKIRDDECPANSIIREIREELEWDIDVKHEMVPVEFDYGFKQIRLFPFICEILDGKLRLNDHVDVKWVSFAELLESDLSAADKNMIMHPMNREILKKYLRE